VVGGTNEDFASGHNFDVESSFRVREGEYLFAVQQVNGTPDPLEAQEYVHITAYIRFDI